MNLLKISLLLFSLSAVSSASAGTGTFDPSTSVAVSTSETFTVGATLGHACSLSKAADVDLGTVYWTGTGTTAGSTSFTLQCNLTGGVARDTRVSMAVLDPRDPQDSGARLALNKTDNETKAFDVNVMGSPMKGSDRRIFAFDNTSTAAQTFTIAITLPAANVDVNKPAGVYVYPIVVKVDFPL
ncbi:hypothetical protein [Deinococcus hopiensis]|uniref:Spore coat protein U domain-containing protein n=1 Tax=Deinococcus hopiensis KR-140 TaxID=695939 RepID=A0A1W1UDS8_9DEIO|nr:hypothetical protein [Deinococcus hopiensis]SMB79245.1 hypothetical protein SAMN00790413_05851 [Deinococcus hopiensis KR-140]